MQVFIKENLLKSGNTPMCKKRAELSPYSRNGLQKRTHLKPKPRKEKLLYQNWNTYSNNKYKRKTKKNVSNYAFLRPKTPCFQT